MNLGLVSLTAEIQYWIERRPPHCAQRWCQERDDSGAGLLKGTSQTAELRAALRRAGNRTWSARGGICVPERAGLPESKAGREHHLQGGIRNSARSWNQKKPDYLTKGWEGILWAGRRNSALGAVHKWPNLHERPVGTKRTDWVSVDLPLICRSGIDRQPSLFSERTRENVWVFSCKSDCNSVVRLQNENDRKVCRLRNLLGTVREIGIDK